METLMWLGLGVALVGCMGAAAVVVGGKDGEPQQEGDA